MINVTTLAHPGMGHLMRWPTIQRTVSRVLPSGDVVSKRERGPTNQILSFGVLAMHTGVWPVGTVVKIRDTKSEGGEEQPCPWEKSGKPGWGGGGSRRKAKKGREDQRPKNSGRDSVPWVGSFPLPVPKWLLDHEIYHCK